MPVGVGPIYAKDEATARKGFEQTKKLGVRVVVGVPFEDGVVNGKKVLSYERGSSAFKAAVKASKYATWGKTADGQPQDWGEVAEGRILLQDHSDSTVSFCNLKIKEL